LAEITHPFRAEINTRITSKNHVTAAEAVLDKTTSRLLARKSAKVFTAGTRLLLTTDRVQLSQPIRNQPDCLRHHPFYNVPGKSYIDIALQAAHEFASAGTVTPSVAGDFDYTSHPVTFAREVVWAKIMWLGVFGVCLGPKFDLYGRNERKG
jgi:hypothetical protein